MLVGIILLLTLLFPVHFCISQAQTLYETFSPMLSLVTVYDNHHPDINFSFLISDGPVGPKPKLKVHLTKEIIAGDHVTFKCTTEGIISNPELTIVKWTKDGEDCLWPEINFTHVTQVNITANYSCKVGNVVNGTHMYSHLSEPVELKVKEDNGKTNTILFIVI